MIAIPTIRSALVAAAASLALSVTPAFAAPRVRVRGAQLTRTAANANKAELAVRALAGEASRTALLSAPPLQPTPNGSGFPTLPPDPYADRHERLPDIGSELHEHGGSYLYQPEGDRLNWPPEGSAHYEVLRLPEDWQKPEPFTLFSEFLGNDPIRVDDCWKWFGGGYTITPEFVGYGSYESFGFAIEQNGRQQQAVGHQLILETDLRLTGTERFHVQFRPLGDGNTGGSLYQFSNPSGYIDNSTAEPTRYWFEGEFHSMFGAFVDPYSPLDYNVVVGKFPFALHNSFLIDDEIQGVVLSKNTIFAGPLSNLNVQLFYGFNDVDTFADAEAQVMGVHATADHRHTFYELTYAFVDHESDRTRDTHFAAISRTNLYGPLSIAGRAMFKWGDRGGRGNGHLFVLESNYTKVFEENFCGVESAVFFCNTFVASRGWNSIGGANLNRIRTVFETNPGVRIAAGPQQQDTLGVAFGAQLFRMHRDESWVPEVAFESPGGEPVIGVGLRYLRKTGPRTFLNVLGTANFSNDERFDRQGVFASYTIVF